MFNSFRLGQKAVENVVGIADRQTESLSYGRKHHVDRCPNFRSPGTTIVLVRHLFRHRGIEIAGICACFTCVCSLYSTSQVPVAVAVLKSQVPVPVLHPCHLEA